jgi:hypothetical protein
VAGFGFAVVGGLLCAIARLMREKDVSTAAAAFRDFKVDI